MPLLTTEQIQQRLRETRAFRRVPDPALRAIAERVEVQFAATNEMLYRIGQIADRLFVVDVGSVTLQEPSRVGRPNDVGRRVAGNVFGLEALLPGRPYTQTAIVNEPSTLLVLDRAALDQMLIDYPYLRRRLDVYHRQQKRIERLNFPGRQNDEIILIYARPHWVELLARLAWPLLILGALIVLSAVLFVLLRDEFIAVAAIVLSLMAFGIIFVAWSYSDWWFDTYIVTNQRVISMLRRPFIQETLVEAPIGKIQNTSLDLPNFWSHALGWSNLTIRTAGGTPIVFKRIGNGVLISAVINELVATARQRSTTLARETRQQQIEARLRGVAGSTTPPPPSIVRPARRPPLATAFSYFVPIMREVEQSSQGTRIIYRKHWIMLLQETALPLLFALLISGLFIAGLLTGFVAATPLVALVPIVILVALALFVLWLYEDWRNDQYILTETSVIDIERAPLYLSERAKHAGLDAIQDVSYHIPHPLAEMLNYGNVLIQTAGADGQVTWDHVPDPREVRREINDRIAEFQRRRAERTRKEQDDDIELWFRASHNVNGGNSPPTP